MGLGLAMGLTAKLGLLGRLLKLMIRAIFAVLFLFGWGLATLSVHVVVAPADVEAPGGFGRDSDASEAERDWRVLVVPKDRQRDLRRPADLGPAGGERTPGVRGPADRSGSRRRDRPCDGVEPAKPPDQLRRAAIAVAGRLRSGRPALGLIEPGRQRQETGHSRRRVTAVRRRGQPAGLRGENGGDIAQCPPGDVERGPGPASQRTGCVFQVIASPTSGSGGNCFTVG